MRSAKLTATDPPAPGEATTPRHFWVFSQDASKQSFVRSFANLQDAQLMARELAAGDGLEYFVYSFQEHREVARFHPQLPSPDTAPR